MKYVSLMGLMCLTLMTISTPANAKGLGIVGASNNIHFIEDIEDAPGSQEDVYLGYMTEAYYLFAGIYMKDAGYVLGIKGSDDSYYEMPKGEELKALQAEGILPDPLPEYKIPLIEYLKGFSLWILLPLLLLWGKVFSKKEPEVSEIEHNEVETKPVSLNKRDQ